MLYVIIGMSLFIIAIGYIVNADNAKHFLAGYNTMKEEERAKVDIDGYINKFRSFHLFLGITLLIGGVLLWYLGYTYYATLFFAIYPILAYMYFMWSSSGFMPSNEKHLKTAFLVMGLTVLFVGYLFWSGNKENVLTIQDNGIHISGSYGEEIPASDIANIELVNSLPKISIKTNGYAVGGISKGHFKTKEGEKVKLFINKRDDDFIKITRHKNKSIYYAAKEEKSQKIYNKLIEAFPK